MFAFDADDKLLMIFFFFHHYLFFPPVLLLNSRRWLLHHLHRELVAPAQRPSALVQRLLVLRLGEDHLGQLAVGGAHPTDGMPCPPHHRLHHPGPALLGLAPAVLLLRLLIAARIFKVMPLEDDVGELFRPEVWILLKQS